MSMLPTFQLRLKDAIISGQAAIGKFDGEHGTLACGTSGGKIFLHNPHLAVRSAGVFLPTP